MAQLRNASREGWQDFYLSIIIYSVRKICWFIFGRYQLSCQLFFLSTGVNMSEDCLSTDNVYKLSQLFPHLGFILLPSRLQGFMDSSCNFTQPYQCDYLSTTFLWPRLRSPKGQTFIRLWDLAKKMSVPPQGQLRHYWTVMWIGNPHEWYHWLQLSLFLWCRGNIRKQKKESRSLIAHLMGIAA